MGKGSQTVTQQNAPNPLFQAAYGQVLGNAEANAAQPLQQYPTGPGFNPQNPMASTGNPSWMVAPFSNNQQQAFGQVAGQQPLNAVTPYLNQAQGYLQQANAPIWNSVPQFSGAGIARYQNPYTQQVVGSTEAQLQNINQQQANQLQGNAASQGALGGDRAGVAQAVLAGQQAAQEAPTIAGLYSQGYGQALQEFNTQQQAQLGATEAQRWLGSQGAFASGQLGQEAMGAQLSNINAELGVGGQQQQQAQANLNVPYYQFQQQQAYPFQTTSWLANIAEGTGSLAGGTGSTTYPQPSIGSQIAGLGLAGAGIASATGGFGQNGWLTGSNGIFGGGGNPWDNIASTGAARGGRLPRRAMGGISPFPTGVPGGSGIAAMSGGSPVPGGVSPTDAPMSGLNDSIVPWASSGRPSPFVQQLINPGTTSTTSGGGGALGDILGLGTTIGKFFLNRGGSVPHYAGGGGILGSSMATHLMPAVGRGIAIPSRMLPRFDDGGIVLQPEDVGQTAEFNQFPAAYPLPGTLPTGISGGETREGLRGGPSGRSAAAGIVPTHDDYGSPTAIDRGAQFAFPPTGSDEEPRTGDSWVDSPEKNGVLQPVSVGEPVSAPSRGIAASPTSGRAGDLLGGPGGGVASLPDRVVPASGSGPSIPATPASFTMPAGGGDTVSVSRDSGHGNNWALPLIAAGLGMMGGRSPNALTNIGEGGMAGVRAYMEQPKMRQEQAAADLAELQVQNARRFQGMFDGSGGGAPGVTAGATPTGGSGIAGGGLNGMVHSSSGQPLFDLGHMIQQAQGWMASGYGPAEKMGAAQLSLIEHMFDKGVVPAQGGGVIALPGAAEAAARQAALIAQGQAPYKIAESAISRAGQPLAIHPGEVATTGAALLPPALQRLIGNVGVPGFGQQEQGGVGIDQQQHTGTDPYLQFASLNRSAENPGGNPAQKNLMGSSAMGNDQFMPDTWLHTFKQSLPSIASNLSDAQILQLRAVPEYDTAMTAALARENAPAIASAGFPVNNSSLRLAHWFGADGAVKLMNAPASAPMESLFSPQAIQQNKLQGRTAGDVVQGVISKFGTEPFSQALGNQSQPATQPPSSFVPSQPPAGITNITRSPPDLLPARTTGSPTIITNPDGSKTSTLNPFLTHVQGELGKEVAAIPTEQTKLVNGQAGLVAQLDEIKRNAQGPAFLQTGWGSDFRTSFLKAVNATTATLGINPIYPDAIATNEEFVKTSTNAAFSLARSMVGARVAVAEVLQAGKANPTMQNSVLGNVAVTNMLAQENKRQIDRNAYIYHEVKNHEADPQDAQQTFDRINPPDRYYSAAMADTVKFMAPNHVQYLQAHPDVKTIEEFNRKYGVGSAQVLLQGQQ